MERSGYDRVLHYLQDQLLKGAMKVGDRLPAERDLAISLGVSRPVVREALRVLAAIGALEIRHGHGTMVRKPDPLAFGEFFSLVLAQQSDAIDDILEARIAIERHAIRLACRRATASDFDELERSLQEIVETIDDPVRGGMADARFHEIIVHAARSPTLESIYFATAGLLARSHINRRQEIMEIDGIREFLIDHHRTIFFALVERDEDKAEELLATHFTIGDEMRRKARLINAAKRFSTMATSDH